uniref:TNT domain-containing protein n=2 Tax=Mycobacterium sp. TaxID=1785 RepID=UPI0031DC2652
PPHALPSDSPLFDGYHPIQPGPEFTAADGSLIYPDQTLPTKPYAVPGTMVPDAQLAPGTELGRFGYPGGDYLAPEGTPFAELSLPPTSALKPYCEYVVADPAKLPPGWQIEQSQVAPWFHQPGGGIQYRIIAPEGQEPSVQELLDWGFLKSKGP